jgi:hypothetical protein
MRRTGTFALGLIADVQYSKADTYTQPQPTGQVGWSAGPPWTVVTNAPSRRAYRESLEILQRAVAHWTEQGVASAVVLGDLLDKTARKRGEVEPCLAAVKAALAPVPACAFTFGNNDADVLSRERWVREGLAPPTCTPERLYHSTTPSPGTRLIFLDTYEESVMGGHATPEARERALAHLRSVNDRLAADACAPPGTPQQEPWGAATWLDYPRRFASSPQALEDAYATQTYNGRPGAGQMAWLRAQLAEAEGRGEVALVFGHCPAHPWTAKPDALAWNHRELRALLEEFSCVQAYIAGHDHDGGA